MPNDILDLIDAAVSDWETGPDAYNSAPAAIGVALGTPTVRFGNLPPIPAISVEFDWRPIMESVAAAAEGFRIMGERMVSVRVGMGRAAAQFARALGIEPPHGSPYAEPCACHPAPFPAMWDYRRRTKHRNRRRR